MILILLLTFLLVKIASPTLPGSSQEEGQCATKFFGEIFCVILFCFFTYAGHFFDPDHVHDPHQIFVPLLFSFTLKVGFPAYYIHSFPALNDFVSTHFKKNVLNPANELKENVSQVLSHVTLRASPQIDVNV